NIRLRLADDSIYEKGGVVEFIDNMANIRTDTIQIYASFDNPEGKLVPGSTVTVLLSHRSGGKSPAVLPSAVMHDQKAAYVYVVGDGNTIERREVTLGAGDSRVQLVTAGLTPGELVVTDGMHKTRPGAVIEPDFQSEVAVTAP
ncbi:MAG: efflux transporter periplasmic adaptor subunit, partial [Planctomycetes bacterium]|nr:efflux transporter periplasmic adaptor subunit [Planctomycetota bacterium]